jgi:hypothetical protein
VFVGGSRSSAQRQPQNTVDTIRVPQFGSANISSFYVRTLDVPPRQAAKSLRVFSQPRTARDRLPRGAVVNFEAWPISDAGYAASRLLAAGYGARLYGVPADDGSVCWVILPIAAADCDAIVIHGGFPHLESGVAAVRTFVSGLASNDVSRVDVQVGWRWHRARLGRNGYLYELPVGMDVPQAVVVRERDGSKHTFHFVG